MPQQRRSFQGQEKLEEEQAKLERKKERQSERGRKRAILCATGQHADWVNGPVNSNSYFSSGEYQPPVPVFSNPLLTLNTERLLTTATIIRSMDETAKKEAEGSQETLLHGSSLCILVLFYSERSPVHESCRSQDCQDGHQGPTLNPPHATLRHRVICIGSKPKLALSSAHSLTSPVPPQLTPRPASRRNGQSMLNGDEVAAMPLQRSSKIVQWQNGLTYYRVRVCSIRQHRSTILPFHSDAI